MSLPERNDPTVEPSAPLPATLPHGDKVPTPPMKDSRADAKILEAWATTAVMLSIAGAPQALLSQAAELGAAYVAWRDGKTVA